MGDVVPLDQVPEQDGAEVFLTRAEVLLRIEVGDFGEAPSLPVSRERILHGESPARRQGAGAVDVAQV